MYKHILVPIDGSTTSTRAVVEAAGLARICGAKIRLLHVIVMPTIAYGLESADVYVQETRPHNLEAAEAMLARARATLEAAGVKAEIELRESVGARVSEVIVDRAADWGADLIVLGTQGLRGINRMLMGSDAEEVARTSPVPVMLVRLNQQTHEA